MRGLYLDKRMPQIVVSIDIPEWCYGLLEENGVRITTEALAEAITRTTAVLMYMAERATESGHFTARHWKKAQKIFDAQSPDMHVKLVKHLFNGGGNSIGADAAFRRVYVDALEEQIPLLVASLRDEFGSAV